MPYSNFYTSSYLKTSPNKHIFSYLEPCIPNLPQQLLPIDKLGPYRSKASASATPQSSPPRDSLPCCWAISPRHVSLLPHTPVPTRMSFALLPFWMVVPIRLPPDSLMHWAASPLMQPWPSTTESSLCVTASQVISFPWSAEAPSNPLVFHRPAASPGSLLEMEHLGPRPQTYWTRRCRWTRSPQLCTMQPEIRVHAAVGDGLGWETPAEDQHSPGAQNTKGIYVIKTSTSIRAALSPVSIR